MKTTEKLHKGIDESIKFCKTYSGYDAIHGEGLKILTPKQILPRL